MKRTLLGWFLLVTSLIAACGQAGPSTGPAGGTQAWIDAPLHGSQLPLAPVEVVAHGADLGGVAMMEFSVNGQLLESQSAAEASPSLFTARWSWVPDGPGNYVLFVRAQNLAGAWSNYAQTTVTVGGAAPATEPPTPTEAPTATAEPVPTTTLEAACTDRANFVADVTIPDNTSLAPGTGFTKTWRLQNDGTCTWDETYAVIFVSGHPMSNATPLPLPGVVAPGETLDLSLDLVAPGTQGMQRADFMLRTPGGVLFGVGSSGEVPFYVQIVVGTTPTPDASPPTVSAFHAPPGRDHPEYSLITFTAVANDNQGVAKIEIWMWFGVGRSEVVRTCNQTTSCSYQQGFAPGEVTYWARAYDAAGNMAETPQTTLRIYVVVR